MWKGKAHVINLDEYTDGEAHCINLYALKKKVYFDSFGVKHVSKEIKKFIGKKNIKTKILRMQANSSIMCGCFALDLFISYLQGNFN